MEKRQEVDTAFTLIEKGNNCQSQKDYWGSADAFGEAAEILYQLSTNEKDRKMSSLYRQQGHEYLTRARGILIKALNEETSSDASKLVDEYKPLQYNMDLLSSRDRKRRSNVFERLFVSFSIQLSDEENVEASQLSIEERLAALNHSIDRKRPENMMKDRLKNLGVYIPYNDDKLTNNTAHLNYILKPTKKVSDEEQVDRIISSTYDEVKFLDENTKHVTSNHFQSQISEEEQVSNIITAAISSNFDENISEKDQVNSIIGAAKKNHHFK